MTAKKAGIGVEFTTRSKGSDVKNGRIKHLGKHPIYKHVSSGVSEFTQETRGGSATVGFTCIDPEVYNIALWKSNKYQSLRFTTASKKASLKMKL